MKKHIHTWDKEKGIRIPAKPWAGLRGVIMRSCPCGRIEEYSNGRDGFHGWYEASNYAKSLVERQTKS